MNEAIAKEYLRLRAIGWTASYAYRGAKSNVAFEEAETIGKVRLRVEADDGTIETDFWTKDDYERAEREGTWGLVAEYRCPLCGNWEFADACYGFIGDDWKDSGYDSEARQMALDGLVQMEHGIAKAISKEIERRQDAMVPNDDLIFGLKLALKIAKESGMKSLLDTPT